MRCCNRGDVSWEWREREGESIQEGLSSGCAFPAGCLTGGTLAEQCFTHGAIQYNTFTTHTTTEVHKNIMQFHNKT